MLHKHMHAFWGAPCGVTLLYCVASLPSPGGGEGGRASACLMGVSIGMPLSYLVLASALGMHGEGHMCLAVVGTEEAQGRVRRAGYVHDVHSCSLFSRLGSTGMQFIQRPAARTLARLFMSGDAGRIHGPIPCMHADCDTAHCRHRFGD